MNVQEARSLAASHAASLTTFLQGVFGDVATAEKFTRFVLQRLEVDFDEIESDGVSARPLYILAREVCREYVSSAKFATLPLAAGDSGLPLSGVLPSGSADALALSLPRTARLALRLMVVDGLAPSDVEPVFDFSTPHWMAFLERISAALPPDGKLGRLANPLSDVATLLAADPIAVAVRGSALPEDAVSAAVPSKSPVDTTQPGLRFTPPAVEASTATNVPASGGAARRATTRTAVSADSGSAPRGVSLSPLVTGGLPANRGASTSGGNAFTRPFPTRTVAALPPPSSRPSPVFTAVVVACILLAGGPVSGFFGKAGKAAGKADASAAASAAGGVILAVKRAPKDLGGIGILELPTGQSAVTPGMLVTAPVRGEAHVRLEHVQIWLAMGSSAQVHADRVVLVDGVARIQVDEFATYVGVADPLELNLTGGTYLLRKGDKRGTGLCTVAGLATAVGKSGRGMRAEAGRTISVAHGGAEVRDTADKLDEGWGREASLVARSVADSAHFSALPAGADTTLAAPGTPTGAGGRALYASAGGSAAHALAIIGADRGAAGYRQAF